MKILLKNYTKKKKSDKILSDEINNLYCYWKD